MDKLLLLLSSPNDMLYPVKFAVKKRLGKNDDDDGKCKYKVNLATQIDMPQLVQLFLIFSTRH